MRFIFNSFFVFFFIFRLNSQKSELENDINQSVYAEFFGQGFCYSLNYEKIFPTKSLLVQHGFSVGLSYVPEFIQFGNGFYAGIPMRFKFIVGKKIHFLELGIGFTSLLSKDFGEYIHYNFISPQIGYRFEPVKSCIYTKLNFMTHLDIASGIFGKI